MTLEDIWQHLKRFVSYLPAISLLNTPPPQKKREQVLNMYVLIYIFIDTAQNSREKKKTAERYETIQMSINGWMEKQTVVHTHNRRLFSHKKNEVLMKLQHG